MSSCRDGKSSSRSKEWSEGEAVHIMTMTMSFTTKPDIMSSRGKTLDKLQQLSRCCFLGKGNTPGEDQHESARVLQGKQVLGTTSTVEQDTRILSSTFKTTATSKPATNQDASGPQATGTFPLLDLTLELRHLVYKAVIGSSAAPPSFPVSKVDRYDQWVSAPPAQRSHMGACTRYPLYPVPATVSSLLLLNRQVHAEVKELISRNEKLKTLTYKLDCMMVDEARLYPTWLSVPALSHNVDVVETNFRLFGDVTGRDSQWTPGDGGPGRMVWSLLCLLERFLSRGPDFLSPPKSTSIQIGLLVLDIVTPKEPTEGRPERETFLFRARGKGLIHPLTVVYLMEDYIGVLLYSPEGGSVRQNVRVVKLCLDGQEMHSWDISEVVKKYSGRD